jgi:O-antigen/teichoic acid export membrane protein
LSSPPTAPPADAQAVAHDGRGQRDRRDRVRRWIGIFSAYFSTQSLVQLLGIATGILFIRTMPVREFALYALAFSVITFFIFVSDLGSSSSLLYFFHRSNRTGEELSPYVSAVLSLRRIAFLLGAVGVAVILPRLAAVKGFHAGETALATAAVLFCVWFQISASLRVLTLRLADRYAESYRAEMAGAVLRLALAGILVASTLLYAWLGILATGLGTATVALLARSSVGPPVGGDLRPYRRKVLRYMLPTLPSALYFSVQGPMMVWLAATFGGTRNIAEVGALSRLGMVVGLFSGLTATVFLPRLSRVTDDRLYRRRYLQFGSLLAAVAGALFCAAALFPSLFLFILGGHYSGLGRELRLVVAGAGLTLLGGYAVSVNLARSWTRWETGAVLVLIACQVVLASVLPLGTTAGVLWFNLLSATVGLMLQLIVGLIGFVRPSWVHWT